MPTAGLDLPANVVSSEGSVLRVRFGNLTIPEQEVLTMVLYSRADSWLGWGEARESDDVLHSLDLVRKASFISGLLLQALRLDSG
jgi:cellulose synthase (UDP-forming)